MKINSNFKLFAGTTFDASKYISSPAYGVNRFMLDRVGDEKARATTIVEYQPNSKFPEHTHNGGEEFFVIKGTFQDQYGSFPAGTYVRNPIGSKHAPWVDEDGCTIFVKLQQMADTNDLQHPLHVRANEAKTSCAVKTDFGEVLEMYSNQHTKERVQMLWIKPDTPLPVSPEALEGGEELFIVEGSLVIKGQESSFLNWGWLRFPPSAHGEDNDRSTLTAGPSGAQVYRKIGHLSDTALSMEKIQIDPNDETVR